jgi:DNA-binding beta-propeller fold protein YncE
MKKAASVTRRPGAPADARAAGGGTKRELQRLRNATRVDLGDRGVDRRAESEGLNLRRYRRDLTPTELARWDVVNDFVHGPISESFVTCIAVSADGERVAIGVRVNETDPANRGNEAVVVYNGSWLFNGPSGVAFDEAGRLYVVARSAHQVLVFDPAYKLIAQNTPGAAPGDTGGLLNYPRSVQVYGGKIYVTEQENHRVSVFTLPAGLP